MSDPLVLCYHAVSPSWEAALSITPDALERQLSWLVDRGWRGATFREAVLNPLPGRTMAVTFDDAFASVGKLAHPILSALGLPGTVFAPTAFMSAPQPLTWPGIDHWARTPFASELESMSWAELRVLSEDGWEIASHTRTHPHLTRLDDRGLRRELTDSRDELAASLGWPCTTIAYPYGDVDERVATFARAAGYRAGAALSSRLSPLGPLRWPRVGIYHRDSWVRFRLKVNPSMRALRASSIWPGG